MHSRVWLVGLLLAIPVSLAGCLGNDESPDQDLGENVVDEGPGPRAAFTATGSGTAYSFDAGDSSGDALSYEWSFGDGSVGSGETVDHTFVASDNAVFAVVLTVTDAAGLKDQAVQGIVFGKGENAAPAATILLDDNWVAPGSTVQATAGSRDPEGDAVHMRIATAFLGAGAPPGLIPAAGGGGHEHHHAAGGGDASYTPAENGFDSPMFEPGDRYELTLDEPGIYAYHCHPHPWMTGTIIVVDDPVAQGGDVDLTAWQVKNFLPQTVIVKPGTIISFDNPDPAPHTVTLSMLMPIDSFVAAGDTASIKLDQAGVHAVYAVATDAKGATGVAHQLVRVSADVPPVIVTEAWSGEVTLAAALEPVVPLPSHSMTLEWPGTASINFTWSGPLPAEVSNVHMDVFSGDSETPIASSAGEVLELPLSPGIYTFQVVNEVGLAVAYEIGVSVVIQAEPDFGAPPPSSDGHEHQH